MNNINSLSSSLLKQAKNYHQLNTKQKTKFLTQAYIVEGASYQTIADATGINSNKIIRDAKLLGIKSRNRSEAQALALKSGRHKHPTQGTQRSQEVKDKISETRAEAWLELTPEERERFAEIGKQQWKNMSEDEKKSLQRAAGDAIRQASVDGSKLERFLCNSLIQAGYVVEFHKERVIQNQNLQVDMWLPKLRIAIEVDGPSHWSPIWGQKTLSRNQRADVQKTGLILSKGMVLIRVRQKQDISEKFKRDILDKLLNTIRQIEHTFPESGDRHIILGDK